MDNGNKRPSTIAKKSIELITYSFTPFQIGTGETSRLENNWLFLESETVGFVVYLDDCFGLALSCIGWVWAGGAGNAGC